ncbi:MAG: tetratricopeptide repeat protein [Chthonomonadales bacterium]
MMNPIYQQPSMPIVIGRSQNISTGLRIVVFLSAASSLVVLAAMDSDDPHRWPTAGLAALTAIICFCALRWSTTVVLDRESGIVTIKTVRPFGVSVAEHSVREGWDLLLLNQQTLNAYGEQELASNLYLVHRAVNQKVCLNGLAVGKSLEEVAADLRDQFGIPIRREQRVIQPASSSTHKMITRSFWAAMFGATIVMMWPLLSGKAKFKQLSLPSFTQPERENPYQVGMRDLNAGRFVDAEKSFREVTETPGSGLRKDDAYNDLAYALSGQNRMDEALDAAEHALKINPTSGNILDTVGEMHELRKEYLPAVDFYKKALVELGNTDTTETNAKLGRTLATLDRLDEATPYLVKVANTRWNGQSQDWPKIARQIIWDRKIKVTLKPRMKSRPRDFDLSRRRPSMIMREVK